MSLVDKIKSVFGAKPEAKEAAPPVQPPRPTSLAERRKRGLHTGVDPAIADAETGRSFGDSNSDPYSTAAWEVDATSGRRRLKKTDPAGAGKKYVENNPYDTSDNLDPWKRG